MTATPTATARAPSVVAWAFIVAGLVLFPVMWAALVLGRMLEVRPLMRFLARSDAHVFFDLPGVLGDLRAFPILFAALPATGVTLMTGGVAVRRGDAAGRVVLVALAAGMAALLVAWLVVAVLIGP